jgi:STE24 endopeptidase
VTGGRGVALLALLMLGAALVVVVAVVTPWRPLGAVPARDQVSVRIAGDFTQAEHAREDAFHRATRPTSLGSWAVGIALALLLGFTPLGARLLGTLPDALGWAGRTAVGVVGLLVLARLVTLPLDVRTEVLLRRYGLSTQTWGSWTTDALKSLGISAVLSVVLVVGLVGLARWLPERWWVPAAGAGALVVVVVSFIYPLLVEPVFNKFTPMPAGPLRTSLIQLADQDHVPVRDVLVADASRRTTTLNAYVSGFGSTRRIVVYDTLLRDATPDEIRLIVAHELGHAKRNDVLTGTLIGALATALGACALFLLLGSSAVQNRAGVTGPGDPRAVALLLALVTLIGTLAGPAQLLVSRRIEARADVHALNLTQDPATFAAMQRRLALTNLADLDPPPVLFVGFASHPTAPQRIAMARTWALLHGKPEPAPLVP